jgi:hypothetical protein
MPKDKYDIPEYVEREILRPVAEQMIAEMAIGLGSQDYFVQSVELTEDGSCHIVGVFTIDGEELVKTTKIYYQKDWGDEYRTPPPL